MCRMCAQCVECVTPVCTSVSLCYMMCYYVPDEFCWLLLCAWCVTVCRTVCGTVLPCVLIVFACVFTLLYLLIQVCRPKVSLLIHVMMSYVCSYDWKVSKFVVYLYSSYMARWRAPVNVTELHILSPLVLSTVAHMYSLTFISQLQNHTHSSITTPTVSQTKVLVRDGPIQSHFVAKGNERRTRPFGFPTGLGVDRPRENHMVTS